MIFSGFYSQENIVGCHSFACLEPVPYRYMSKWKFKAVMVCHIYFRDGRDSGVLLLLMKANR